MTTKAKLPRDCCYTGYAAGGVKAEVCKALIPASLLIATWPKDRVSRKLSTKVRKRSKNTVKRRGQMGTREASDKQSFVNQILDYKAIDWRKLTTEQLKRITDEVRNARKAT